MQLKCSVNAASTQTQFSCIVAAIGLLCHCYATAMQLKCSLDATVMHIDATLMQLRCNSDATLMQLSILMQLWNGIRFEM